MHIFLIVALDEAISLTTLFCNVCIFCCSVYHMILAFAGKKNCFLSVSLAVNGAA